MRNVPWSGDQTCNEVIGIIENGKKYPFGCVTTDKYNEDMATLNTQVINIGSVTEYVNEQVQDVESKLAALTTRVNNLDGSSEECETDIAQILPKLNANTAAITNLTAALNALEEDVDAVAESTENNTAAISSLNSSIGQLRETVLTVVSSSQGLSDRITSNTNSISSLNTAVSNVSGSIETLAETVTRLTARVSSVESDLAEFKAKEAADISALTAKVKNAEDNVAIAISTANKAEQDVTAVDSRQNQIEAAMSALSTKQNSEILAVQANVSAISTRVDDINTLVVGIETHHEEDMSALGERIDDVASEFGDIAADVRTNTANISSLNTEVNSAKSQITALSGTVTTNTSDIAVVKNGLSTANGRISDISAELSVVSGNLNTHIEYSEGQFAELSQRIDSIEQSEPANILSFTATPNICELGGVENIVLRWDVTGDIEKITLNDVEVEGDSITKEAVDADTEYTLKVRMKNGGRVSKTINVQFVNHIKWGTTTNTAMTAAIVNGLENSAFTDEVERSFKIRFNDEYMVYAYPKRLGKVDFTVSGFTGGFEDPVTVSVTNHSEYKEDYYVYRSTQKLYGSCYMKIRSSSEGSN